MRMETQSWDLVRMGADSGLVGGKQGIWRQAGAPGLAQDERRWQTGASVALSGCRMHTYVFHTILSRRRGEALLRVALFVAVRLASSAPM